MNAEEGRKVQESEIRSGVGCCGRTPVKANNLVDSLAIVWSQSVSKQNELCVSSVQAGGVPAVDLEQWKPDSSSCARPYPPHNRRRRTSQRSS